jgi:hypothetical protein
MGFALGLHGLKPGFAWFQTQDKPAKNRVYFLTPPKHFPTPCCGVMQWPRNPNGIHAIALAAQGGTGTKGANGGNSTRIESAFGSDPSLFVTICLDFFPESP